MVSKLLYAALVAQLTVLSAAGMWKEPVEQKMSEWCVLQFAPVVELKLEDRLDVYIEPYIGNWCFAQFSTNFVGMSEETSVQDLYHSHVPIELQIFDWGVKGKGKRTAVEPFLGDWCAAQWPEQFPSPFDARSRINHDGEIPIEGVLGEWCYDSFPALATVPDQDRASLVQPLYQHGGHVRIEDHIIEWYNNELSM